MYWLELYVLSSRSGHTTPVSTGLVAFLFIATLYSSAGEILQSAKAFYLKYRDYSNTDKVFFVLGFIFGLAMLAIGLRAALLPPHLLQEFDALNYHLTLPRQHLIRGSFLHIPWSSADLFPLPIQFGLAPYWLATELPNKLPQAVFFLGLMVVCTSIAKRMARDKRFPAFLVPVAILGSHGITNQLGTAMLDIVIVYLFFAAIDSLSKGYMRFAAVEAAFFFWSKSFMPIQIIVLLAGVWLGIRLFKSLGWSVDTAGFAGKSYKKFIGNFLIASVLIGGPFVVKSLFYAGTPLYPFASGMTKITQIERDSIQWKNLRGAAQAHLATKDQYGHGRSVADFFRHFWLLAVPEKGVTNAFDYPMGLPYLLCLGPFLLFIATNFAQRRIVPWSLFIIGYWALWWFGSQQTRFVYIPVLMMLIMVICREEFRTKIFILTLILSVLINFVSVLRAHRHDFFVTNNRNVLRLKDNKSLALNAAYNASGRRTDVYLNSDDFDVPFAEFPVMIKQSNYPFVIGLWP